MEKFTCIGNLAGFFTHATTHFFEACCFLHADAWFRGFRLGFVIPELQKVCKIIAHRAMFRGFRLSFNPRDPNSPM